MPDWRAGVIYRVAGIPRTQLARTMTFVCTNNLIHWAISYSLPLSDSTQRSSE